jgi:hypothetical protein
MHGTASSILTENNLAGTGSNMLPLVPGGIISNAAQLLFLEN